MILGWNQLPATLSPSTLQRPLSSKAPHALKESVRPLALSIRRGSEMFFHREILVAIIRAVASENQGEIA